MQACSGRAGECGVKGWSVGCRRRVAPLDSSSVKTPRPHQDSPVNLAIHDTIFRRWRPSRSSLTRQRRGSRRDHTHF